MHVVTEYPNGLFSWVDLTTTDTEAAKAFYTGLFGWEAVDMPTDVGTVYTMLQIDGKNVAGLGPMPPNMPEGTPAYWASYVKHDDVDSIMDKVTAAGGQVVMPAMDVMEEGRMAIMQDPAGAMLGVWQPKNHIGAQLVNMPNALVWNELQTKDLSAAKDFYVEIFGWGTHTMDNGYVTVAQDERMQAGMMQIGDDWPEGTPSNWQVYFMTDDVEAMAKKVTDLGGAVMVPPTSAGEMGRFIVVADPQGGVFTIMEFDGPVDLPPGVEA